MSKSKALAELRSLEVSKRGTIDDESVPFLAHLRDRGLLNDSEWTGLKTKVGDAIELMRESAQCQGGPISVDADPRNADWIRLVHTYKLIGFRLPGWATFWLRLTHPDSDSRFWREVRKLASEFGLTPIAKNNEGAQRSTISGRQGMLGKKENAPLGLRKLIMEGISNAHEAHRLMSRERFGRAPEYLITTKIAEVLSKKTSQTVYMEKSVQTVLEMSGGVRPGKVPPVLRGRFDIFVSWKNQGPRALIEVKHPVWATGQLMKDIRRVTKVLNRAGESKQLRVGFLPFYSQAPQFKGDETKAKRCLGDRVKQIRKEAMKELNKNNCIGVLRIGGPICDKAPEGIRWGIPCCLVIKRGKQLL